MIIGEEDRITAPSTYPYSAIGRISHRSGIFCTGFLVAKNIVVTNAHCLLNANKEKITTNDLDFYLESQKKFYSIKRMKMAQNYEQDNMRFDFAFLELDEAAGEVAGTFGTRAFGAEMDKQNILQLSGYAVDVDMGFKLFRQGRLCQAQQPSPHGLIMHDCDMEGGSSGAPMFTKIGNKYYVVGINSRQSQTGACSDFNNKTCFNLAIPFQHVGNELQNFINKK